MYIMKNMSQVYGRNCTCMTQELDGNNVLILFIPTSVYLFTLILYSLSSQRILGNGNYLLLNTSPQYRKLLFFQRSHLTRIFFNNKFNLKSYLTNFVCYSNFICYKKVFTPLFTEFAPEAMCVVIKLIASYFEKKVQWR